MAMNTYKMASNNNSLVDNVTAIQADITNLTLLELDTPTYQTAAQHLIVSDWDILNEIQSSLPLLLGQPEIQWVKGHQDQHKPYESLCLLAQLNVDADPYAGEFQDHYGTP
jgi:hypothetical protein